MIDPNHIRRAYETVRQALLAERTESGHWVGELSASPLSTATAVSALSLVDRHSSETTSHCEPLVSPALKYLIQTQNDDGGWGDTDQSLSNIATTMLVVAAFHLADQIEPFSDALEKASHYIDNQEGIVGLRRRFGRDRTFATPILTNAALAGQVPWQEVSPLPFELACLPHRLYRFLRLPVVSYAIPALVAVGQARFYHRGPLNPFSRILRACSTKRSLRVLERMQPDSGGYLEATPLTSFVVMSLASTGRVDHPVTRRGVDFLKASVRKDGSWPIDTNLATWTTTLSINGLSVAREDRALLGCLDWLLSCQQTKVHPFTHASPGGWGWTDLSGGVPDADDTASALLALRSMRSMASEADQHRIDQAAKQGLKWLLNLQNRNGGWPTFCPGWGKLPFDRSGVDLTAHAIRAIDAWLDIPSSEPDPSVLKKIGPRIERAFRFLAKQQGPRGRWIPLWFGNQYQPEEVNPYFGTARVLLAYRDFGCLDATPAQRGMGWLLKHQNLDGGWGGYATRRKGASIQMSSVEETAITLESLISCTEKPFEQPEIRQGLLWLLASVESGSYREPSPIGFYFAKLWYYERLYPLVFTVSALGHAVRCLGSESSD